MAVKYADQIAQEIKNRNIDNAGTVNGEAFEEWLCKQGNNGLFSLKRPEDVFPKDVYQRMQNREKAFVLFTESMQIYGRKSYDEWAARNGTLNETPRITYMYIDSNERKGYVVHYNRVMKSILIPEECISVPYDEFIQGLYSEPL